MKFSAKYLLIILLSLSILTGYINADDKELFMGTSSSSKVKPNVVVLIDSSGSMQTIIFFPENGVPGVSASGFNPSQGYSGNISASNLSYTKWQGYWVNGTSAENYQYKMYVQSVSGNTMRFYIRTNYSSRPYTASGDWFYSRYGVAKLSSLTYRYRGYGSGYYYHYYEASLSDVKDEIKTGDAFTRHTSRKFVYAKLYGTSADGSVRYNTNYWRWIFLHATDKQRESVSHFSTYGTFDLSVNPPRLEDTGNPAWEDWWTSDCSNSTDNRIKYRFTRIQVAREVVCKLTQMSNEKVYMGLFRFNTGGDPAGGYKMKSLTELTDSTTANFKDSIYGVPANSWTPLAETLADIWSYYKPGSDYDVYYGASESSDIKWWCQSNYAIIMTDGEPTKDDLGNSKYSGSIFRSADHRRIRAYSTWKEWRTSDGWGDLDSNGHAYLDDVAYFLRHQDMYPDVDNGGPFATDTATGWPNEQNIITYTIGFTIDNQLLKDTAKNGDGEYYTASNYQTLVDAFQSVITSILLREFAFSSITAPRRTTTTSSDEINTSYFGYFKPAASAGLWEGHLIAFPVTEKWGYDIDGNGKVDGTELLYDTKEQCLGYSGTKKCAVSYNYGVTPLWDAATKIPDSRNLYTQNSSNGVIGFNSGNKSSILPQMSSSFGPKPADQTQNEFETDIYNQIVGKLHEKHLADIFHSDVQYVGAPPKGKLFSNAVQILGATDPRGQYQTHTETSRTRMVYTGTNDGILHAFYADGSRGGEEAWGFIPKEILPSLHNIVINNKHTYTVDGRITASDIYDHSANGWRTYLYFGLRDGGNAYYAMNITSGSSTPDHKWTFKDSAYSGKSWGRPIIGRMKYDGSSGPEERHIVVLTGGMAFNNNSDDKKGKAVFIVDAITGELIWMIGYNKSGGGTGYTSNGEMMRVTASGTGGVRVYVAQDEFSHPVPSSLGALDTDNDGYLDTLFFGNTGGHVFKIDMSNLDPRDWKPYIFYKHNPDTIASTSVSTISDTILNVASGGSFKVGHLIQGSDSKAMGYITEINGNKINVKNLEGTFNTSDVISCKDNQPLFIEPAIAYDNCDKLWVTFGTGNRNRPRTDPTSGRYFAIIDRGENMNTTSTLTELTWKPGTYEFDNTTIDTLNTNGWYFRFPDSDNREKLHDPSPVIVPDSKLTPHILFNTYQPPKESDSVGSVDNPCAAPDEGSMKIYDIQLVFCGLEEDGVEVKVTSGRIAGGGMVGRRYLNMMGGSSVGGTSLDGNIGTFEANFPGSIIFWQERKR